MNNIYKTPLLTSWPNPFTWDILKEFFGLEKKPLKRKIRNEARKQNLFAASY